MRLGLLMAVMYVMGRLGLWAPYGRMVDMVLKLLNQACYEEWGPTWQESLDNLEAGLDG